MRGIDRALVDEVWRELAAYSADRAASEAEGFLERQPHVAALVDRVLAGQPEEVQRAGFGLGFLLFRIVERGLGQPFPLIADASIRDAQAATARFLEESAVPAAAALTAPDEAGHPTLAHHLMQRFYGEDGGGVYDEGVRARLALVLRTISAAIGIGPAHQELG